MQVFLEAIQFNHDPNSATQDAFNIRRNETEVITIPEWRRGVSVKPEDSPAAYARDELAGRHPTIRAKFSFLKFDPAIKSVWIRALDSRLDPEIYSQIASSVQFELRAPSFRRAHSDNVLGSVIERKVQLAGGEEFELFNLSNTRISSVGVTVNDIVWRWQFRTDLTGWQDFATTTHRIYTVLAMPTLPWQPRSSVNSDTQQPWAEVLDYACRWAASAYDVDQAATLVTESVSALGNALLKYDEPNSGSRAFTSGSPDTFDCTEFLKILRGQKSRQGAKVNCDDCAAFVASFSNILGCDLNEGSMGTAFDINPQVLIGLPPAKCGNFVHHTVAWKGTCGENNQLFDACVQLDADGTPAAEPHQWKVPTNIQFRLYRSQLAVNEMRCLPLNICGRRRIAIIEVKEPATPAKRFVEDLVESSKTPGFPEWRLFDFRFIYSTDSMFAVQSFWAHQSDDQVELRVDFYLGVEDPKAKVTQLLFGFQLPDIVKQEEAGFGDVVHAVPTGFAILFSRGNSAVQLRNIGSRLKSAEDLARSIDKFIVLKTDGAALE